MPTEIAVPFRIDASGGVAATNDPNEQIRNHVMSLINTEPWERTMISDYGVPLDDQLFENDDEAVAVELSDTIRASMAQWEPGVLVQHIAPVASEQGIVAVDVRYSRVDAPGSGIGGSGANTAVIRVGGFVDEVVRG